MHIRPYNSRDREHIRTILEASRTFTAEEVAVALEVIDDAVSRPQSDDYTICCAENDTGKRRRVHLLRPDSHDRSLLRPILDMRRS